MGNFYDNGALLDFLNRGGSAISAFKFSIKNYFFLKEKNNTTSYNKRYRNQVIRDRTLWDNS